MKTPQMETQPRVKCSCTINERLNKIDMLHCKQCNTYQHGVCLFFRNADEFPKFYSCLDCIPAKIEKPCFADCIVRLFVAICFEYDVYPNHLLKKYSYNFQNNLYNFFVASGLLIEVPNSIFQVNRDMVNEELMTNMFGIPEKFRVKENEHVEKK